MTETEQKALALVNEVGVYHYPSLGSASMSDLRKALLRAIEQHEAYKQEVSDAVEELAVCVYNDSSSIVRRYMGRFIIPKPADLVAELLYENGVCSEVAESLSDKLRGRFTILEKK